MDLCSTLGLLLLHMYMYGWNVYAWQQTRINYGFIFEFSPGTELRYRQVLLICTALSSMLLGTMIVHIIASAKEAPNYNHSEWAPMAITLVSSCFYHESFKLHDDPVMIPCQSWAKNLNAIWWRICRNRKNYAYELSCTYLNFYVWIQVFLVMLLIPANILYKSSRYFFLRCFRRIVFAPFYKVHSWQRDQHATQIV
jgi:hypothetical protein